MATSELYLEGASLGVDGRRVGGVGEDAVGRHDADCPVCPVVPGGAARVTDRRRGVVRQQFERLTARRVPDAAAHCEPQLDVHTHRRRRVRIAADVRPDPDERQAQPVVDDRRVDVADRVHAKHVAATVRETRLLPLHITTTELRSTQFNIRNVRERRTSYQQARSKNYAPEPSVSALNEYQ